MNSCWLVTGAHGCIGAWVVKQLLEEGERVVASDVDDPYRIRIAMDGASPSGLVTVRLDVTNLAALEDLIDRHEVTAVVHLAALQIPFCRADPPLGAAVNVVGTVNVLEAVNRRKDRIGPFAYASSAAALDVGAATPPRSTGSTSVPTRARPWCTPKNTAFRAWASARTRCTGPAGTRA